MFDYSTYYVARVLLNLIVRFSGVSDIIYCKLYIYFIMFISITHVYNHVSAHRFPVVDKYLSIYKYRRI